MPASLVYSHIYLYRSAMNLLYAGRYRRRFRDIVDLIGEDTRSVCDLCFGDTMIADWCRGRGIRWTGVDLNPHFCARARRAGHHVIEGDLFAVDVPTADVFVMAGSLYHFHDRLSRLFDLVWRHTGSFVLSEPVHNLSAQKGPIGWWARRSADPGDGLATFRYDGHALLEALREQQRRQEFAFRVVSVDRDMLVVAENVAGRPEIRQEDRMLEFLRPSGSHSRSWSSQ